MTDTTAPSSALAQPRTLTKAQRWRRRYGLAAVGAAIIVLWILVAVLAPLLAPYSPDLVDVTRAPAAAVSRALARHRHART